jgi:hypothetical protein
MERSMDLRLGKSHYFGDKANRNAFRQGQTVQGITMRTKGLDPKAEGWGTMALTTTAKTGVSYRTAWSNQDERWGQSMLDFWDDFSADGAIRECEADDIDAPMASLAVQMDLPPHATRQVTFLISWHFPNRYTWTPAQQDACCQDGCCDRDRIGNYYAAQYRDPLYAPFVRAICLTPLWKPPSAT